MACSNTPMRVSRARTWRARHEYGLEMAESPIPGSYDVVVIAVSHDQFRDLGEAGIRAFGREGALVYDIKYLLPKEASDDRL